MDKTVLARGFVVGLALAAPVGPIAIVVVRRSLADGVRAGLASGVGVATADAIFALLAALGVASLGGAGRAFELGGGLFLVGLGARTFLTRSPPRSADAPRVSVLRAFASTLVYTLANPVSILTFAAVAASLRGDAFSLVLGVFTGSLSWWLLLATVAGSLRRRVSDRAFGLANRAAGVALVAFGIFALVH